MKVLVVFCSHSLRPTLKQRIALKSQINKILVRNLFVPLCYTRQIVKKTNYNPKQSSITMIIHDNLQEGSHWI